MRVKSHVSGIPCLIDVTFCQVVPGSFSWSAVSDVDYYGHEEISFDVLDRKGRRADWLEKKMTDNDRTRIEMEIVNFYKENRDE